MQKGLGPLGYRSDPSATSEPRELGPDPRHVAALVAAHTAFARQSCRDETPLEG